MAVYVGQPVRHYERILVCGGRDYADAKRVAHILDCFHKAHPFAVVIEGGARGADNLGYTWAQLNGIPTETYEADWKAHGKKAGPLRNQRMIDEGKPDLVVAFSGGRGTADMLRRAQAAGIDWIHDTSPQRMTERSAAICGLPGKFRTGEKA